ncbi:MAG: isocitrate lyase/phosphoenolpyruvate mutase family protein [Cyanobacteria bacterium]|nr:isocitrate lyase/phosphoenolpyruvate mutase family protein [Cyanobacteriota bacterium]
MDNSKPLQNPEALLQKTSDKPARLRERLKQKKALAAPGAFNAITAKIIESIGYELVYVSGAGLNNGVAGYPDIGMLSLSEMVQFSGYIASAVSIPTIADADTGFGEAIQVFRTVKAYENAGLSGIHLEDQVFPKRCGHLGGKQVIATEAMCEKIRAAVAARSNPEFLLIARVDSRAVYGLEDAISRSLSYIEAGADMIFTEAMETEADFAQISQAIKTRYPNAGLLANMTEFGKSPLLPIQTLESWGYDIVIYPMTAFRLMMKTVADGLSAVLTAGTQEPLLAQMTHRKDLYRLIHYDDYEALDKQLSRSPSLEKS